MIGSVMCEITIISSLVIAISNNVGNPDEQLQILLLFVLQGMILLSILSAIFRFLLECKQSLAECCREKSSSVSNSPKK